MKEKLISIIVPVYQVEEYLSQCIESIIRQTYKDIEIILVDDGSLDSSGDICNKFARTDNRIKVIHTKNGGVSKARNIGLQVSHGEYVCFIDADDYIKENYIEYLYRLCIENKADISICGVIDIENGQIKTKSKKFCAVYTSEQAIKEVFEERYFYCVMWAKMFKKILFQNYNFCEGTAVAEDLQIIYKIFDEASNIVINTKECLYYYRVREGSAQNSEFNEKHEKELEVLEEAIRYLRNNHKKILGSAVKKYINVSYRLIKKSIIDEKYNKEFAKKVKDGIKKYKKELNKRNLKIQIKNYILLYGQWLIRIFAKKKNNKGL